MKIVAQVNLLPASTYDADALAASLRACGLAANAASEVAFAKHLKRRRLEGVGGAHMECAVNRR